jgi:hypothetical protein
MLFADYTMTNTFFFEYLFLLDVVPEPPISIYYGFVKHICKIFRPKENPDSENASVIQESSENL